MDSALRKDTWVAGDLYEPYVGRWSRLVAPVFFDWLAQPPGCDWLDVGCGTGALTRTLLAHAAPRSVIGVDPSPGFVDYAAAHVKSDSVCFQVGDAQALSLPPASVDAVVSGLVLNFVPQPRLAVAEMMRVARDGAIVAAYVWDYAGKMELMRYFWDAAAELDPAARELDEGLRFALCQPAALTALFGDAGLKDVEVRSIDVPTVFQDFQDYWSPFLGGQGPAPGYAMSLGESQRNTLRDLIKSRLPTTLDGAIPLVARTWAVRGKKE